MDPASSKLKPAQKKTLILLHGWMGSPKDFDRLHLLFSPFYNVKAFPIEKFVFEKDAYYLAYSMGGRMLLSYLPQVQKAVLIASHPGLLRKERPSRALKEKQILKWMDRPNFLNQWYDQDLFKTLKTHPDFKKIQLRREQNDLKKMKKMFLKYRLSKQPKFKLTKNTLCLVGEFDEKYQALYQKEKISYRVIKDSSHACHLENPQDVFDYAHRFFQRSDT